MLRVFKNALLISVPYSIICALLSFIVTLNWAAVSDGVTQKTYYGVEAVQFLIKSYGLANYLLDLAPQLIFFFIAIFIALITQGYIFYRKL